jgi:hypothetical protein
MYVYLMSLFIRTFDCQRYFDNSYVTDEFHAQYWDVHRHLLNVQIIVNHSISSKVFLRRMNTLSKTDLYQGDVYVCYVRVSIQSSG